MPSIGGLRSANPPYNPASCDPITTLERNCAGETARDRVRPRFRPDLGSPWPRVGFRLGLGHKRGIATCLPLAAPVLRASTSELAVLKLKRRWFRPCVQEIHPAAGCHARSRIACGLCAVLCRQPKIRTSRHQAGVAGPRSNDIVHDEEARGRREKAYAVRVAQGCGRRQDGFAWGCELLHRGNEDGERRKIQHARNDRRASDAAVRHQAARDQCGERPLGDGAGQRPRSLCSRAASSTSPIPRPTRWEWWARVSPRSNSTSCSS